MESPAEFARQLRSLREANGISIRALANLVGVSSVTIWKWEKGETKPRAHMLPLLAKALDIKPIQLSPPLAAPQAAGASSAQSPDRSQGKPSKPEETAEGARPELAISSSGESLADVISRAKQMIAEASGTGSNNITILIEY